MRSGSTYRIVNVDAWDRREQFHLFKDFDDPLFGFTADLRVTRLYRFAKERGSSFFAHYLFASQQVVNGIPEFRYRIIEDQLIEYEQVSAGSTILKENQVFTFCNFLHEPDLERFVKQVGERIAGARAAATPLFSEEDPLDQIYYSVIPWIHFNSVKHPRRAGLDDSVPRIVFGKATWTSDELFMPISVEAHHALLDGYHLGIYYERLQKYFDDPKSLLER